MLEARKKEQEQQEQQQQSSTASPDAPRVERVVLTTEDVTELLNLVEQDDEYLSDASDILFSIHSDNVSLPGAGVTPLSQSRCSLYFAVIPCCRGAVAGIIFVGCVCLFDGLTQTRTHGQDGGGVGHLGALQGSLQLEMEANKKPILLRQAF